MHNWWVKFSRLDCKTKLNHLLIFALIFTLPINLFLQIDIEGAYLRGLLVDYLIRKVYLHQIILLALALLNWPHHWRRPRQWKQWRQWRQWGLLAVLLGLLLLRQFSSPLPVVGVSYLLSLGAGGWLVYWLASRPPFQLSLYRRTITIATLATIITQSALAYLQFYLQRSIFPYWLLGESNLHNLAHIARGQFFNIELILPYASSAHPNILAGFITLFSLIIWRKLNDHATWQRSLLLTNLLLILAITQSLSATATLLLYPIWRSRLPRLILALLMTAILILTPIYIERISSTQTHPSVQRRAMLNQAAWQMWLDQPLWGVGLHQFTTKLETYAALQEIVRFVQPTHHLPLLILSEGGLLFLLTMIYAAYLAQHHLELRALFVPTAIFSLDHYLLTQSGGWLLLLLFLYLSRLRNSGNHTR